MPSCPVCLGQGEHDFSDFDAYLEEHLSDEALARAKACAKAPWRGSVECGECEGTGVVTDERHRDIMVASRARIDQFLAGRNESGP